MSNLVAEAIIKLQIALSEARTRQEGQTLVEYSLILAMVSIGSIVALLAVSGKINAVFNQVSSAI
jgi:Flp pilus assembly pilin Flp